MENFALQTSPCSFLKSRISPWEISFPLLLCSFNPGALIFFHWQHYPLVPSYPHPILSFSLYLLPHAVQIRVVQHRSGPALGGRRRRRGAWATTGSGAGVPEGGRRQRGGRSAAAGAGQLGFARSAQDGRARGSRQALGAGSAGSAGRSVGAERARAQAGVRAARLQAERRLSAGARAVAAVGPRRGARGRTEARGARTRRRGSGGRSEPVRGKARVRRRSERGEQAVGRLASACAGRMAVGVRSAGMGARWLGCRGRPGVRDAREHGKCGTRTRTEASSRSKQ
jgi:hypothetical protein